MKLLGEDNHRECEECGGMGSFSPDCTTFGTDCACNGPRIPCKRCEGTGSVLRGSEALGSRP